MKSGLKQYYYGIELSEDYLGKNDGKYEGKRYFKCGKGQGVFVTRNKIDREVPLHFCVITNHEESLTDILSEEVDEEPELVISPPTSMPADDEPLIESPKESMKAASSPPDWSSAIPKLLTRKTQIDSLSPSAPIEKTVKDPMFKKKASKPDPGMSPPLVDGGHARVSSLGPAKPRAQSVHDRILSAPATSILETMEPRPNLRQAVSETPRQKPSLGPKANSDKTHDARKENTKTTTPPIIPNLPFLKGSLFAKPSQQIAFEKKVEKLSPEERRKLQQKRESLTQILSKVHKSRAIPSLLEETSEKHRESLVTFKTSKNRRAYTTDTIRTKLAGLDRHFFSSDTLDSISDMDSTSLEMYDTTQITIGCKVKLEDGRKGKVVYDGKVQFAEERMLGVILDKGEGEHDGKVQGRRYFSAPAKGAVFRTVEQLTMTQPAVRISSLIDSRESSFSENHTPTDSAFKFGTELPIPEKKSQKAIFSDLVKQNSLQRREGADKVNDEIMPAVLSLEGRHESVHINEDPDKLRILPNTSTDEFLFIPHNLSEKTKLDPSRPVSSFEVHQVVHKVVSKDKPVRPRTQSDEIKQLFKAFDVDRDGRICVEEIFAQFNGELSHEEIEQMIASVDDNHNGSIDVAEFGQFMHRYGLVGSPVSARSIERIDSFDQTRALFDSMDKDGDGFLEAKDLSEMLSISVSEAKELTQLIGGLTGVEAKMDYKTFQLFCDSMGGFGDIPVPHSVTKRRKAKSASSPVEDQREKLGLIQLNGTGELSFRQDNSFSSIDTEQPAYGGVSVQRNYLNDSYGGVMQQDSYGGVTQLNESPQKVRVAKSTQEHHDRKPSFFDDKQKQDVVFKCHCAAEAGYALKSKTSLNQNFVNMRQENVADLCIYVVQQTENALRGVGASNPEVLNEFLQASIMVSHQGNTELAIPIDHGRILVYVRYDTGDDLKHVDGVLELWCAPSKSHAVEFRKLMRV